ncbi:hypothetical protein GCM10010254_16980 [Streptomyces chromofuscus]|nr:hypothetical protein GCM10010254_16980 [Streptomyces chromofuscus]
MGDLACTGPNPPRWRHHRPTLPVAPTHVPGFFSARSWASPCPRQAETCREDRDRRAPVEWGRRRAGPNGQPPVRRCPDRDHLTQPVVDMPATQRRRGTRAFGQRAAQLRPLVEAGRHPQDEHPRWRPHDSEVDVGFSHAPIEFSPTVRTKVRRRQRRWPPESVGCPP